MASLPKISRTVTFAQSSIPSQARAQSRGSRIRGAFREVARGAMTPFVPENGSLVSGLEGFAERSGFAIGVLFFATRFREFFYFIRKFRLQNAFVDICLLLGKTGIPCMYRIFLFAPMFLISWTSHRQKPSHKLSLLTSLEAYQQVIYDPLVSERTIYLFKTPIPSRNLNRAHRQLPSPILLN